MFSNFTTKIIIFTLQPKIPSRTKSVQTVNTAKSLNTVAGRKAGSSVEFQGQSWECVLFLPTFSMELVQKKYSANDLGTDLFQSHPFIYFINEAHRGKRDTENWHQNSDNTLRRLLSLSWSAASTHSIHRFWEAAAHVLLVGQRVHDIH